MQGQFISVLFSLQKEQNI